VSLAAFWGSWEAHADLVEVLGGQWPVKKMAAPLSLGDFQMMSRYDSQAMDQDSPAPGQGSWPEEKAQKFLFRYVPTQTRLLDFAQAPPAWLLDLNLVKLLV
jgi:hypothetical protein